MPWVCKLKVTTPKGSFLAQQEGVLQFWAIKISSHRDYSDGSWLSDGALDDKSHINSPIPDEMQAVVLSN